MNTEMIFWYLFGAVLFVGMALILVLYFKLLKLSITVEHLEKSSKAIDKERLTMRKQLTELHAGAVSMGNKIVALEDRVEHLGSLRQDMSDFDPDSKLYSRAIKMIKLGADLQEVMAECEIPKAEAELLFTLHR